MAEYLQFDAVSKTFPGVKALDAVSFGVREGSVHALVGENGAGKSTLLKILGGAYHPSAGSLLINGSAAVFHDTADALHRGVAVIYQELHLAPELSVAENLFIGHLPAKYGFINHRSLLDAAKTKLNELGENIDPRTKVGRLPIGQRQMVEIAKALTRGAKIIAFDEPTSSLSDREIKRLFRIIADLKSNGHVILYVSHRMEEIFQVCDSVTVLRDGRHIKTFPDMKGLTRQELVRLMVGREITDIYGYAPRNAAGTLLQVDGLLGPGLRSPVSLRVAGGEVVGIFGLVGAGRTELLKCVFGAAGRSGSVAVDGKEIRAASPAAAIRAGMMLCPEDRKKEGIVPIRPVIENINISARRNNVFLRFFLNNAWERSNAESQVKALAIKTPGLRQLIMNLSGGNQQKVILGRWLSERMRVLLLDEPTRGIDVGAKSEIYSIMYKLASLGVAILMVSSDLPEVLGVSDRILVMRQGALSAAFSRQEASAEKVLAAALPIAAGEKAAVAA
jgi:L-arabinose transport system ATP-binding protein